MISGDATWWPWWAGALLLASVGAAYWFITGNLLGASGLISRVCFWTESAQQDRSARIFEENPSDLEAALLAATKAQFGDRMNAVAAVPECGAEPAGPSGAVRRLPLPETALFLSMLLVGGLISGLTRGGWRLEWSLGPGFDAFFGGGGAGLAALFGGGILVGLGTRMAGGCTSGHGLNGCSRLQPGSLVATGAFMAAGVAVSLLLKGVLQ